jgi:hypothetical protein
MANSVFLPVDVDVDGVSSGFPVSDEGHVRQKHWIPLALTYHSFDRVAQKNGGVSVSQLTGALKIEPGDVDGLFQQFW